MNEPANGPMDQTSGGRGIRHVVVYTCGCADIGGGERRLETVSTSDVGLNAVVGCACADTSPRLDVAAHELNLKGSFETVF